MNQKFIIRVGIMMMLVLAPLSQRAFAASAPADASQSAAGNTVTVKGTITDDKGEPLPGASVMVKGTTVGTVTDIDGKYSIQAKPGQTLVISYIGFKDQEKVVGTSSVVNVALADDSTLLDDVVVVGYGSIKRANLTGAVDAVDSKIFENKAFGNATQMINEVMPNVEMVVTNGTPWQKQVMSVRGNISNLATINGNNQGEDRSALILIDGVEGDLELINPNDIESVSVIKDAAAAAIYGTRGAIGVILVTTKDPSKQTSKFSVNYSANFNIATPTMLPDYVTDGLEFSKLTMDAYGYWYADADGNPSYSKLTQYKNAINFKNGYGGTIESYYNAFKEYRDAGNTDPVGIDSKGNYLYFGSTDWYKEIYKDYVTSQIHNISISGNSGKIAYLVSGRIYDYDGLYKYNSDTYKTANLRSKVSAQILPWLKLTENMDFTYDAIHKPLSTKGTSVYTPEKAMFKFGFPSASVYNPDGTMTLSGAQIVGPLLENTAYKDNLTKTFKTTTGLTAAFFDNTLRFNADFTYRMKNKDARQKVSSYDYSAQQGVIANQISSYSEQYLQESLTEQNYYAVNAYAEYENRFGRHGIKLMGGYNYESRDSQQYVFQKTGMLDAAAESFELFDDPNGALTEFSTSWNKWRVGGAFFRFNYNYDERYLLEVNGRYDGSSKFSRYYQWSFFPSVSAGWRLTSEHWWPISPKFISNLKIRASYGELGDAASIGSYGYEETFTTGKDYIGKRVIDGNSSATYWQFPEDFNSAYTWARIKTTDIGVDLGLFSGRFNASFDYYKRRSLDMLVGDGNYADTFGSDSALGNNADMTNRGWELTVNYNDSFMMGGKPFNIGFRGTLADNKTVIDRYPNETGTLNKNGDEGYYAGMTIGEIWGYKVGGIWQNMDEINNWHWVDKDGVEQVTPYNMTTNVKQNNTKYRYLPGQVWFEDLDGDGTITKGSTNEDTKDWTIVGNKYPRYQFSFGFDLEWNGIFANATFTGVGHQDASLSNGAMWGVYVAEHGTMPKYLIGRTAEVSGTGNDMVVTNPDAFYPTLCQGSQLFSGSTNVWNGYVSQVPTDRYTFNVGYIKLRNLQIGYSLPKKLISRIGLSDLKIYFSGENLWNWSPVYKYIKGFDVTTIAAHIDDNDDMFNFGSDSVGSQYPILRTYSLGINLTIGHSTRDARADAASSSAALAAALAAANEAAAASAAQADRYKAQVDELQKALSDTKDSLEACEAHPKTMAQKRAEAKLVEDIYFDLNESVIKDSESYKVDELIKALKADPDATVEIYGYADQATGTAQRNLMLTKERALVVADALKAAGISSSRIYTEFYGTEKDSSFTPENNRLAVCIVK